MTSEDYLTLLKLLQSEYPWVTAIDVGFTENSIMLYAGDLVEIVVFVDKTEYTVGNVFNQIRNTLPF